MEPWSNFAQRWIRHFPRPILTQAGTCRFRSRRIQQRGRSRRGWTNQIRRVDSTLDKRESPAWMASQRKRFTPLLWTMESRTGGPKCRRTPPPASPQPLPRPLLPQSFARKTLRLPLLLPLNLPGPSSGRLSDATGAQAIGSIRWIFAQAARSGAGGGDCGGVSRGGSRGPVTAASSRLHGDPAAFTVADKATPPPVTFPREDVTGQTGRVREVAQPGKPLEAGRGAAPVGAHHPRAQC